MHPVTGVPTLVGTWYGELTTPTGRRQWLALDLDLDSRLRPCTMQCLTIKAEARVCDSQGERRLTGGTRPANWSGTRVALTVTGSTADRYQIIRLKSERESDVLKTIAELESTRKTSTGAAVAAASEDSHGNVVRRDAGADELFPIKLTLRRGSESEYAQACGRLAGT
jgi:hypothetical protein